MIQGQQAGIESRLALNRVMDCGTNRILTELESETNIADNLVTVASFDGTNKRLADGSLSMKSKCSGTGLRLTTDGFILTAYHNIQPYVEDWKRINEENPPSQENISSWLEDMKIKYAVVDQQRNAYPIDTTFWAFDPAFDIALIKAVILERPKTIEFRVSAGKLEIGDEIKLLGLRNQRLYNQYGKVLLANYDAKINHPETGEIVSTTYDTFKTDAYGVKGFSGGAFTNMRGEFVGLASYISRIENKKIGQAGGAKVKNIANLIKESVHKLNEFNK